MDDKHAIQCDSRYLGEARRTSSPTFRFDCITRSGEDRGSLTIAADERISRLGREEERRHHCDDTNHRRAWRDAIAGKSSGDSLCFGGRSGECSAHG